MNTVKTLSLAATQSIELVITCADCGRETDYQVSWDYDNECSHLLITPCVCMYTDKEEK